MNSSRSDKCPTHTFFFSHCDTCPLFTCTNESLTPISHSMFHSTLGRVPYVHVPAARTAQASHGRTLPSVADLTFPNVPPSLLMTILLSSHVLATCPSRRSAHPVRPYSDPSG
ncbi:unnamed protein product [Microthlaspi erraticum]|uniref:Uncharacterized protein n=1 Tax=Microthlaspi erraticum TaxID=1685480 RepID=A0A6D2IC88_9BRAS|nr:unnamed protein product [Microthlaspi erraticum]